MPASTMAIPLDGVRSPGQSIRMMPSNPRTYERQRRTIHNRQGLTVEAVRTTGTHLASTEFRTGNALASASASASFPPANTANAGKNPQRAICIATITLSVVFSVAMVITLAWYLRLRRREKRAAQVHGRTSPRGVETQASRVMLPLQTSFHPSFKSSFGFTGASPDSPWSRTDGTITPLTRAAGQEFLFSPVASSSTLADSPVPPSATRSPTRLKALPLLSATLPAPPVTANTTRTFRTSIHSIMVNRDSFTTNNISIAEDQFTASSRPRTRLPSYHADYHKSATSPYAADLKKGFIPGPESPSTKSSPSDIYHPIPNVPPIPDSVLSSPTKHNRSRSASRYQTPPTFRHVTSRKKSTPRTPLLRTRESLKEYLDHASTDGPSDTASLRVRINTDSPSSARPSMSSHTLSDDLRGLLFLAPSVVVDDRPRSRDPANPDLSPTAGWTGLPQTNGQKLA